MSTFLIDENLPRTLQFEGKHKFLHIVDINRQMSDTQIWHYAKENDCIIITKDADFYNRMVLYGPPPKVIWIRLGNMRRKQFEHKILNLWSQILQEIKNYNLLEIYEDRIERFKIKNET